MNKTEKMEKVDQKIEEIIDVLPEIASWWHKWEEIRDGRRVVCIEFEPKINKSKEDISTDYSIV